MLVTFTNTTSSPIYLSAIYKQLEPTGVTGSSVQARRTPADLDANQQLKAYVVAGDITLAFTLETGDSAATGPGSSPVSYSNATRPAASTVPTFSSIWNTDDNALNWSDSVNWRDALGNLT
jgi:hypothetical protein